MCGGLDLLGFSNLDFGNENEEHKIKDVATVMKLIFSCAELFMSVDLDSVKLGLVFDNVKLGPHSIHTPHSVHTPALVLILFC